MIDRKTALACAALIALMLVSAAGRLLMPDEWTASALPDGVPPLALLLFFFPLCSALVVGALYWGSRAARAEDAKLQPWRKWGKTVSIGYCVGLLLLQGVLIAASLRLDMPLVLSALARVLGLALAIMCLLAINRMPKLPWFERRFQPGGDLGPIYGPRYMRGQSTVLVVFMVAVIAYSLVAPPTVAWRFAFYVLLTAALLVGIWSIAWRWHLGRKWKLEQRAARGVTPP
jgi:hypothetical protein